VLSLLLKFGLALGVMLKRMTKSKYILRYRPCYTLYSNELTSKQTVKENAAFATTMQRKYAPVQSICTPKLTLRSRFYLLCFSLQENQIVKELTAFATTLQR
jgi:hypothetical protein